MLQGLRRLPFSAREEVSRDEPYKFMTDDCVVEVELNNLVTPLELNNLVTPLELNNLVTPLELKAASSNDVTLTLVRHFSQNGWPRHLPVGLET